MQNILHIFWLVGISGIFYIDIFSVRLFWGIDSALVGVALIHIGHLLKKKGFCDLLNLGPIESLILLFIGTLIAMSNGSINMRTLKFSNPILFWMAVLMLIIAFWNLCRHIAKVKIRGIKEGMDELEFIGRNSIVYVCLNQSFISVISTIIPFGEKLLNHVIIFILTIILLRMASLIIIKTKLRVLIGKWWIDKVSIRMKYNFVPRFSRSYSLKSRSYYLDRDERPTFHSGWCIWCEEH